MGHSIGGQIAQWVASSAPDRVSGLVLVNTVPASGMQLPPEAVGLFRTSGGDRQKIATILSHACKHLPEPALNRLLDDAVTISPACMQESFDAWTGASFTDRLKGLAVPTLVLGTDDPFLPLPFLRQAVVSVISGARLAVLPGPGHYPLVERRRETAAILQAFLASVR